MTISIDIPKNIQEQFKSLVNKIQQNLFDLYPFNYF